MSIRACGKQLLDDFAAAAGVKDSAEERRVAMSIRRINRGTGLDEPPHDRDPVALRSEVERRPIVAVSCGNIGAHLEKNCDRLIVPLNGCMVQRCSAKTIPLIHVPTSSDCGLQQAAIASQDGINDWRWLRAFAGHGFCS